MADDPLTGAEEQAYQESMAFYRSQILDPMRAHVEKEPFCAMTLALLAVDHLSSATSESGKATTREYIELVQTLPGFEGEKIAKHLHDAARNGMAHQFVTETTRAPKEHRRCVRFTGREGNPFISRDGDLVVSVAQFVDAVMEAWRRVDRDSDKKRLVSRRIRLDVVKAEDLAPRGLTLEDVGIHGLASETTFTAVASGSTYHPDAYPPPTSNREERRRGRRKH